MKKDYKQSTLDALNKFSQKQLDDAKPKGPSRKHGKPEKEVEKSCMALMRSWGWSVQVIESKATWNGRAWVQQGAKQGTLDCIGNTDEGISASVEFKAPKRLGTLRFLQRKFIIDKINTNSFSCVTDSQERLKIIYETWRELRKNGEDFAMARNYLLSMLPREKTGLEEDDLFADE